MAQFVLFACIFVNTESNTIIQTLNIQTNSLMYQFFAFRSLRKHNIQMQKL